MLRRREFLKQSVVVATVASTGILNANATAARANMRIDFAVYDEELEDSIAFARELGSRGAQLFPIQQDIGQLWFGALGRAFTAGKIIAGMTSHSELLVCEAFGRERGAKLRYEGSHDCRGADVLTHSLRLARDETPFSTLLAAADAQWPRALAAHLPELTIRDGALHEDRCRTTTHRTPTHPGSLFSWLIA